MTVRLLAASAVLAIVVSLLDVSTVLAGHGYDTGSAPRRDTGTADDGGGGIGLVSILAVAAAVLVVLAVLISMNPKAARARMRTLAPILVLVVLIATPLVVWTATSGGDPKPLVVERGEALTGKPELLVSLTEKDMNTLAATSGRRSVRIRCVGRDGRVVVDGRQKWPFVLERGYDYPHAHQLASREQVQRVDRCQLRGTSTRLEADVEGTLEG
jgi:hypothetical protein